MRTMHCVFLFPLCIVLCPYRGCLFSNGVSLCPHCMISFFVVFLHMIKERSDCVRFSDIQKKEVIDGAKGSFLGYVQDATIDIKTGMVEALHISEGERGFFFDSKQKEPKKVFIKDITIIGKDIVLVGLKDTKE